MISLYTGTPGSGKSYHATERIDMNLKRGVNVIANYKIKTNKSHKGEFIFLDNSEFSVKYLIEYASKNHILDKPVEHQTMIVIDEAAIIFPKKDYDKKEFQLWMTFFRLHRQMGYDVILITQNPKDVNSDVLGLVEYNYKHRKLTSFGIKGWFLAVIFRKKFISVKYWYVIDEKCDSYMFNIRKRITRLYDTFGMYKRLYDDVQNMIGEIEQESQEQKKGIDVAALNARLRTERAPRSERAAARAIDEGVNNIEEGNINITCDNNTA